MTRNSPSPTIRGYAGQLLVHEASGTGPAAASQVFEGLRRPLIALTGVNGFSVLLARALALTQRELPRLNGLSVTSDGTIEGLSAIGGEFRDVSILLVAYLLELLITFIGESLMLQIVAEVWPDLALGQTALYGEGEHGPTN